MKTINDILTSHGIDNEALERELSLHVVNACREDVTDTIQAVINDVKNKRSDFYDMKQGVRLVEKKDVLNRIENHKPNGKLG